MKLSKDRRLRLLDEKLYNGIPVKLQEQLDYLYVEYNVEYDIKTMQRDIDALKELLMERYENVDAEILYKKKGVYRYIKDYCAFDETKKTDRYEFAKLFKFNRIYSTEVHDEISNHIASIVKEYDENEQKVITWHPVSFINKENAGQTNFAPLLNHINLNEPITFTHRNIRTNLTNSHLVVPILLKEVDNGFSKAWFMLGQKFKTSDKEVELHIHKFNIYNVDRIRNIAKYPFPVKIKYPEQFEPNDYFKESYKGTHRNNLSDPNYGPEFVKLKILDNETLEQLKKYPLHTSQKIISKNNNNFVELSVETAYDLQKFILGNSENVVVVHPQTLKEEIKKLLIRANKNYGILE